MVGDRVLDNFQELLLGVDGSDCKSVKKLDHETCESFEGTWDSDCGADFNEDSFGSMNIDLKLASFVDRRIKESEEALHQINKGSIDMP